MRELLLTLVRPSTNTGYWLRDHFQELFSFTEICFKSIRNRESWCLEEKIDILDLGYRYHSHFAARWQADVKVFDNPSSLLTTRSFHSYRSCQDVLSRMKAHALHLEFFQSKILEQKVLSSPINHLF